MADTNYYDILGLGFEADEEDILEAYERAREPIKQALPVDVDRLRTITEAYMVLSDPVARAEYDATCVGDALLDEADDPDAGIDLGLLAQCIAHLVAREQVLRSSLDTPPPPKNKGS
jgi:hypothetical protein